MASYYESTNVESGAHTISSNAKPKFLQSLIQTSSNKNNSYNNNNNDNNSGKNNNNNNETPIFSKRKMALRIPEAYTGEIMHMTVSKNWLLCILAGPPQTTLLRFFLPRAIPPGEVPLDKHLVGYKISKLFIDDTGHHILVSLVPESPGLSADFLYIHGNGPKVRRVEKFKDHEISAVAFNAYAGTETTTGPILLGTKRGLIFETELTQEAERASYRKQLPSYLIMNGGMQNAEELVYDLGLGRTKYPIHGMQLLRMPNSQKYVLVANTNERIYTFHETLKSDEKTLQSIFTAYVNGSRVPIMLEIKNDLNYSLLQFYAPPQEKYPTMYAWLCGAGLRMGTVLTDSAKLDAEESNAEEERKGILLGDDCISLEMEQRKHMSIDDRRLHMPKAFVLSEYHALLLYGDRLKAICMLNQQPVYEEHFGEQTGKLQNIVRDQFTGAIYWHSKKAIFNMRICEENRHIWQIYLDRGQFELAAAHAADNPFQLEIVLARQAQAAFEAQQYEEAARIYAETEKTFEEICLQFMPLEDKRPIINYVRRRLKNVQNEQITVLVVWLTDLYLTQINAPNISAETKAKWQQEYDEFMRETEVAKCTQQNRTVIQQLIAAHADAHNLSQFAIANGDYEEVIRQQLVTGKYADALQTLRKHKQIELYYKYAPLLMEQLPRETVELLMAKGRKLRLDHLLPALVAIDNSPEHVQHLIKYLEYAIYNLCETNEAAHNYLLRLYAEHKPYKVVSYLANEGDDISLVHYDINYAIGVCREFETTKVALVFLQCLAKMWPAAVDLALTFDLQLAKETASKQADEEQRRKLWLRIAQHEIQETNDVKKALELLQECNLLRIEDLLPYFDDFQEIDDFKEPICKALKEYNQNIQELQNEMEECTKQAERVRKDLQNVRENAVRIGANECCTICETYLLVKPFFVFACGHKFHNDCLEKQVIPLLSTEKSRRLTMLKQQFEGLLTQAIASGEHTQSQLKKRDNIRLEIEEILAGDCLYCGLMIETIDQPFVEDWDQVYVDWA